MSQRAVVRCGVVAGIIAAAVFATSALERSLGLTLVKPSMPLTKPLPSIPKELGIPVRYTAKGPDRNMDPEVVSVLGTRDYLLRDYRDTTKTQMQLGETLSLNLNYYSKGDATPHVPEICWAGSGLKEATRYTFDVPNVKLRNGKVVTIPMRMISFHPRSVQTLDIFKTDNEGSEKNFKNVAYTFNVNGEYVNSTKAIVSTFWNAKYKYAYYSKIEVTVDRLSDPKEAEKVVGDFIREALANIEECLPDPSLLLDEPAGAERKAVETKEETTNNPR